MRIPRMRNIVEGAISMRVVFSLLLIVLEQIRAMFHVIVEPQGKFGLLHRLNSR